MAEQCISAFYFCSKLPVAHICIQRFLLALKKEKVTETETKTWINNDPEGAEMSKRMKAALIGGALLGLICVAGAYIRSGFTASPIFVLSLWYNRLIIGLAVGAPWTVTNRSKALLRGALLGLLVSFAFYSSTGFVDHISFVMGILYGVILEAWLSRPEKHPHG